MNDFKEFQSKSLDMAINEACEYFNTEREKLEIEILEDSKSGVFGIIGARKARIRARKVAPINAKTTSVFQRTEIIKTQTQGESTSAQKEVPVKENNKEYHKEKLRKPDFVKEQANEYGKEQVKEQVKDTPQPEPKPKFKPKKAALQPEAAFKPEEQEEVYDAPEARLSLSEVDPEKLLACGTHILRELTSAITGDIPIEAEIQGERLCLTIDPEDSGLLIGREGQTLAALEYLVARMVSRELDAQIRVHIEIGDYRSKQDDRLHNFALQLAEKVRMTNKSTSTRPLSAYQRRIVHLALQDMPDLQTRSTGDGALKRVIIIKVKH